MWNSAGYFYESVECGVDIFLHVDMQKIREKSLKLADLFIQLVHQECSEFGFELITPLDP